MDDVLVITARHEEELAADRAELYLNVEGSSLVTGGAALKKAKEVSRLVEELARAGVDESHISLENVHAEMSSGLLSKSSSASYRLRVDVGELERLPEILGAATSTKNVKLERLVWCYPESAAKQAEWLAAAIAEANLKAAAAATALGTKLAGIHRFTEQTLETAAAAYAGYGVENRKRSSSVDLGFELGHKKRAGVAVTVEYRVVNPS